MNCRHSKDPRYPRSNPQTLLPRARYWKQSTLGLVGSGNETKAWVGWLYRTLCQTSVLKALASTLRQNHAYALPSNSLTSVQIIVSLREVETTGSIIMVAWVSHRGMASNPTDWYCHFSFTSMDFITQTFNSYPHSVQFAFIPGSTTLHNIPNI